MHVVIEDNIKEMKANLIKEGCALKFERSLRIFGDVFTLTQNV